MKRYSLLLCLMAASILSACTGLTATRIADRPLDSTFRSTQLTWSNGGKPLTMMYRIFDEGGRVALCGAYAFEKDNTFGTTSFNDLAIANSSIRLNGETLHNDLGFFNRATYQGGRPQGNAACVVTDRPWTSAVGTPELVVTKSGSYKLYD